jgi:hypothetical protein
MKKIILSLVLSLISLLLLTEVYKEKIVEKFNFGGFVGGEPTNVILGYSILFFSIIFSALIKSKVFKFYAAINIIFLLQPSMILMVYGKQNVGAYLIIVGSLFMVGLTCQLFSTLRVKVKDGIDIINYEKTILNVPMALIILVLFVVALKVNFEIRLDFSKVYDYRFDLNDHLSFPYNYIIPFAAGPLLGFASVAAIVFKAYYKAVFIIFFGFLFYGFTTHKSYLFIPLFSILVFYSTKSKIGLMNLMQIFIIFISATAALGNNEIIDTVTSMVANRVVFLPSLITFAYIEEFSRLDYMFWSESKISFGLISSTLSDYSVNHIGRIMTGDPNNVANVGWVANGFMNLGFLGVVIYSIIVAALLRIIEFWDTKFDRNLILPAFSISIMNIVLSVDIIVSMLSTGLLFMLIYTQFISKYISKKLITNNKYKKRIC